MSAGSPAELVEMATAELRAGRAVIIPTDTVYGLAALPENVDLLFELKQRPSHKAVAILVARPADAESLFDPLPATSRLMDECWPGALTIVQDGWGVRCPDHPLVQALASAVGPIATTSANLSGHPTPHTATEAAAAFPTVQLVIDGGRLQSPPSTVVEVTETGLSILRQGAVDVNGIV
ncbi:L-threonylcarbamoyladenylate synthase [Candidatus Poriferisocius sp.]|uniref:L-threonylcarbamoyladenylate synthase n=1 Tax=Candidatus Poriferisocius sp. TaxID=3101276 RepID=UPI003B0187BE